MRLFAAYVVLLTASMAIAGPLNIDRRIRKEPKYSSTPRYGLLAFGPDGMDRVWMVQDGAKLFVDRNGNGDLTEPGEQVAAREEKAAESDVNREYVFEVGELTVGGKTHKGLSVYSTPLKSFESGSAGSLPSVKAALAKDPKATTYRITIDVDVPGLKAGGVGERASFLVGQFDLNGVLQFSDKPADAPVIHLGGPLEVTFYASRPTIRAGRGAEFILVVGTPGEGPGTLAMLNYADTIPKDAYPVAELVLPPTQKGGEPVRQRQQLVDRC